MAAPDHLRLAPRLRAELQRLAQRAPHEEICGLIGGNASTAGRLYPVANIADVPSRFFEMDPRGQIDALRTIRDCGQALVAIYHSHPRGPAAPSIHDIARHEYPDAACILLAVDPPALKAFRMVDGAACEIPLLD